MKRNNEGYVLAMVMTVIAVLAVVASAMLSIGLRNVQTQQAAIDRMQERYDAEGAIEKAVAVFASVEVSGKSTEAAAENAFSTELDNVYNNYQPGQGVEKGAMTHDGKTHKFSITAKTASITICAEIELMCKTEPEGSEYGSTEKNDNTEVNKGETYSASVKAIRYASYKTSATTSESSGEVPSE